MTDAMTLSATAEAMVAPGHGILAADESVPTISKRFGALGIDSTFETRRQYRELLLGAPGIEEHISGVILHDETIRQEGADGRPFPQLLADRGILPGIKVDTGAKPLALAPGEVVTEGLDGLRERLEEYVRLGARFAKWRAVITIDGPRPSRNCVVANAHALARYAALCQESGVVPIVEPEVLMDGAHDIGRCDEVTRETLTEVFSQLDLAGVDLKGMVLKPSMVIAGSKGAPVGIEEVAEATVACLRDRVPAEVPGVAFLSGGQSPETATAHLNAIARLGPLPWAVTFSYGRALQDDTMRAWAGDPANVGAAQSVLHEAVARNGDAALGRYQPASPAHAKVGQP
ncbi:MAG: class I fructose-bisphosphate aldolase [Acidimicrobiales bacterium]